MNHLVVSSAGLSDWRRELADPVKHWKRGRSAFELAVSWELAAKGGTGLPREVADLLATEPTFRDAKLLVGVVEHEVALEGGSRGSRNDLWALLRSTSGLVSMAVEGKAGENFGDLVRDWSTKAKEGSGKPRRLAALERDLGLEVGEIQDLRYQLIHRAASAVMEARRFSANSAIMIVQSFADHEPSFADFQAFSRVLGNGREVGPGILREARTIDGIRLFLGWARSSPADDAQVAKAAG